MFELSREFTGSSAAERVLAAAGVVAASVGSAAVWYFNPSTSNFFPVCPLFSLTGFACPGCGLTRGFHALFHGDIVKALDYNALTPLIAIVFAFVLVSMLMVAVRGRAFPKIAYSPKTLSVIFVLLAVFGVVRNLPFYPFSILYP